MEEFWKDIEGYEGLYQVSNFGRVKSLERLVKSNNNNYRIVKEKILKQNQDKDGYRIISLNKNNKGKSYRLHRLVAEAFIPNPNNYLVVNHKDENKENNYVDNLEWCTIHYNNIYGHRIEKAKKNKNIPLKQCDLFGNIVNIWNSATEVCNVLGYDISSIRKCCNKKRLTAYGFKWENL